MKLLELPRVGVEQTHSVAVSQTSGDIFRTTQNLKTPTQRTVEGVMWCYDDGGAQKGEGAIGVRGEVEGS